MDEETQPPTEETPPQSADDSSPEPAPEPEPPTEETPEPEVGSPEWLVAKAKQSKERREASQREDPTREYQRQLEDERRAREAAERKGSMTQEEMRREFKRRPVDFARELGMDPAEVYNAFKSAAVDQGKYTLERQLEEQSKRMEALESQLREEREHRETANQRAERERAESSIRRRYVEDVQAIAERTPLLSGLDEDDMIDLSMVAVQRFQRAGIDEYTNHEVALAAEQMLRRAASRGAEAPTARGEEPQKNRPKRGQSLTASAAAESARQPSTRGRLDPDERNALMRAELERAFSGE